LNVADRSILLAAALALLPLASPAQQDDLRPARTRGSANAPVTVFEMADFQCPVCGRFAREIMPALEREYVATGKVKWVYVNFPLPMHPNAEPAAELAMCAARQGRFWAIHDLLYRHQEQWSDLHEPAAYFLTLADSAGADREPLVRCLRTNATRDLVKADADGSVRSGASGTPNFYIEGGIVRGMQPLPVFRQILDSVIRAKARTR
jgi:protein-disulfide isomerase